MTLKQKLATAEAEIAALRKALDPTLQHLRFENGELNMALSGPLIENFGLAFGEHFRKSGAKNYIEMSLHGPEGETYIVTCQKIGGDSPGKLVRECREILCAVRNVLEEAVDGPLLAEVNTMIGKIAP